MQRHLFMLAATTAALFAGGAVRAQSLPPIEESIIQGSQIEEAIGRTTGTSAQRATDAETLAGEPGIYVIKREDIFYVAANAGLGYDSNPLRTIDNVGGSGSVEGALTAGVRTKLGGLVDFGTSLNFAATEYFKDFAPSSSTVNANVSLGVPLGHSPIYLGVSGFAGENFGGGLHFRDATSFYGGSGYVSATLPIGQTVIIQPTIAATRQWTGVTENNNKSVAARLGVTTGSGPVSVTVSGAVSRVWYDNFYEDVTFVERKDWQYEAALSFSCRIAPKLQASASVRYAKRDSTFFLANYEAVESAATVGVLWRF